jgi:hypothetical protein
MKKIDFSVVNHGSVVLVTPQSRKAKKFVNEQIVLDGWQWLGDSFAVEPRFVGNLLDGIIQEGMTVQER